MKKIITVSREFGSGGRIIAQDVAKQLGYKYYDRLLIEKIEEKSGLAKEFIEEQGEHATSGQHLVYNVPSGFGWFPAGQSVFDKLYTVQYNIIKEVADEDPCVIVGRCADYILRNRTDCLKVFIHADMDFRIERSEKVYAVKEKDTRKFLEERDKKRKLYYKYNTDRCWDDISHYDLCLKSSALGMDTCTKLIIAAAKEN